MPINRSVSAVAAIGLANSVASCFLTALGLVLQQAAQRALEGARDANARANRTKVPIDDFKYLCGLGCVFLGALGSFVCDGMLPQSTLAPLTCQIIVYKVLLGKLLLGDTVSRLTGCAVGTMVVGMVVSLFGANLADRDYTLKSLLDLFLAPAALAYSVLALMALFALRRMVKLHYADQFTNFLGLAYLSLAAGMVGGWSGVIAKALVEMSLTASQRRDGSDFYKPWAWIFVLVAPWLVSIKLKYVSVGLACFSVQVFMPLYQAVVVACNAVCGIFYYEDFRGEYDPALPGGGHIGVFVVGTSICLVGVLLMLRQPKAGEDPAASSSSSSQPSQVPLRPVNNHKAVSHGSRAGGGAENEAARGLLSYGRSSGSDDHGDAGGGGGDEDQFVGAFAEGEDPPPGHLSQWGSYVAAGVPGLGLAAVPNNGSGSSGLHLSFGASSMGPRPFTASDRADDDSWLGPDAPSNIIEL